MSNLSASKFEKSQSKNIRRSFQNALSWKPEIPILKKNSFYMAFFNQPSQKFLLPQIGISTERCIGSFFGNYLLEALEQNVFKQNICWIDVSIKFAEEVQKILEEKNREDFFLSQMLDVTIKNYLQTEQLIDQTLNYLQTDFLDLVFIPKMTFSQAFLETKKILQNCVKKGKIRFLGLKHQDPTKGPLIKNSSLYRSFQLFELPSSYQELEEFQNPNLFSILSIGNFPKTLLEDPYIKEKAKEYGKTPAEGFLLDCLENNFHLLFSLFALPQIFPQKKLRDISFLQKAMSSLSSLGVNASDILDQSSFPKERSFLPPKG